MFPTNYLNRIHAMTGEVSSWKSREDSIDILTSFDNTIVTETEDNEISVELDIRPDRRWIKDKICR